MTSAACHHVMLFAIACKITSWIFTARSQAACEYRRILPPQDRMADLPTASSGQITC
jgi:ABC-type uncharacterized transport system permease subunit